MTRSDDMEKNIFSNKKSTTFDMSLYDSERVGKISTIMPNFANVAQKGDVVRMGLEGDPLYDPSLAKYGTIERIENGDLADEKIVTIRDNESGTVRSFSSTSIKPNEVWEFTDDTFKNVLNREQEKHRAEQAIVQHQEPENTYRGSNEVQMLRDEISNLRAMIESESTQRKDFSNTVIETMKEIASDVCKTNSDAPFCRMFQSEYHKMVNRAEGGIYRGSRAASEVSVASSSKYNNRDENQTIEFSESDSLASDSDSDAF